VTETYEGEVGIGDGWWLQLPEPFAAGYDEDGDLVLERPTMVIFLETITYDPESTDVPADQLVRDVADDAVATSPASYVAALRGQGWTGHLLSEVVDEERGEQQLLGCLGAPGAVLNLTVRFLEPELADQARAIIAATRFELD